MSIVLHVEPHWVSPYVFACFVTLKEKGLPFEARELDAAKGETRTTEYLSATVTGRVPTLVHDGFGIGESSAIVEYLEEVFPDPPMLPLSTKARARFRQLSSWMRSDDTALIRAERPATTLFYEQATSPLSEDAARAAKKLCAVADRLLGDRAPTLFERWSVADAELAFLLRRLTVNNDPVPDHLRVWVEAQWARPSIQAYVTHARPAR